MKATLGLGTVQFGLEYGLSNKTGRVNAKNVKYLLDESHNSGIDVIDTAYLYGDSERVLGENDISFFKVVTKTPHFNKDEIVDEDVSRLISSFKDSLQRMNIQSIYGLLIHNADDLLVPGGNKLFEAMRDLKSKGYVEKIGASVYDSEQVDLLIEKYDFDLVQVPINVFDQRLINGMQIKKLKQKNIEIHVRSVFLQGLLLMNLKEIPDYFKPILPILNRWHSSVKEQGFSKLEAALSFVRDIDGVDVVLIGVQSMQQLSDCVNAFAVPGQFNATNLSCEDPQFVNPAFWKLDDN